MDNQVEDYHYWLTRPQDDKRLDWRIGENWVNEYADSSSHPHRELILRALGNFKFYNLLEIGCNCGPNLVRIQNEYHSVKLAGMDANPYAIRLGMQMLPKVNFRCGDFVNMPYASKSFDIVLADATIMYTPPELIENLMNEIDRVANKGIILVEWDSSKKEGELKDFHWAYDFKKLLKERNFYVKKHKLTKKEWPTEKWHTNGCLYIASRLPFKTSKKS